MSAEAATQRIEEIKTLEDLEEPDFHAAVDGNTLRFGLWIGRGVVGNTVVSLLVAALAGGVLLLLWHERHIGWITYAIAILVWFHAWLFLSPWTRRPLSRVLHPAATGLLVYAFVAGSVLIANVVLTILIAALLVRMFVLALIVKPTPLNLFAVDPVLQRIVTYERNLPKSELPIDNVDFFLAYRGSSGDDISGSVYAVSAEGAATRLTWFSAGSFYDAKQTLVALGYVTQRPVWGLDDYNRGMGREEPSGFALTQNPDGTLRITDTDRETLFEQGKMIYKPGQALADVLPVQEQVNV